MRWLTPRPTPIALAFTLIACLLPALTAHSQEAEGEPVQLNPEGYFVCASQELALSARFLVEANHESGMAALFANEGDNIDCFFLEKDDESTHSFKLLGESEETVLGRLVEYVLVRVYTAEDDGSRGDYLDMYSFAAGFFRAGEEVATEEIPRRVVMPPPPPGIAN